jgi:flagellar basal body-associated protein FliL
MMAGAGTLVFIVLAIAGFFVYNMISKAKPAAKKVELEKIEFEAKDNVTFEEFTIFLIEGESRGVVKFTVNAEVASTRVKEFLERKKPAVRDAVSRTIMTMKSEEVKNKYYKLELHDIIKKDLNRIVDSNVKGNTPDEKGEVPQMNLVVKVNIFDFSAMIID